MATLNSPQKAKSILYSSILVRGIIEQCQEVKAAWTVQSSHLVNAKDIALQTPKITNIIKNPALLLLLLFLYLTCFYYLLSFFNFYYIKKNYLIKNYIFKKFIILKIIIIFKIIALFY